MPLQWHVTGSSGTYMASASTFVKPAEAPFQVPTDFTLALYMQQAQLHHDTSLVVPHLVLCRILQRLQDQQLKLKGTALQPQRRLSRCLQTSMGHSLASPTSAASRWERDHSLLSSCGAGCTCVNRYQPGLAMCCTPDTSMYGKREHDMGCYSSEQSAARSLPVDFHCWLHLHEWELVRRLVLCAMLSCKSAWFGQCITWLDCSKQIAARCIPAVLLHC